MTYLSSRPSHLIIPDTQVRPGVPIDHLRWIGHYILAKKPDKVIHLGDHWDMASLSSYAKGKMEMENRRYRDDVRAGNRGLAMITAPTRAFNVRQAKRKEPSPYEPEWHLLRGNHEHRIQRAIEDNAVLEGAIGYHDFADEGWTVHDFLEPVLIDGVWYCHYFYNQMSGRALGGMVATRLKTIGHSFTQGHQQTLDFALRPTIAGMHHGLVAGSCYLHDEEYRGPQGNGEWRGIIVKHEVHEGHYDIMTVSLDYLCRRYEGMPLDEFLASDLVTIA